jgi:glycosyltransferase involved in cell wall biosynthesis
MRILVLSRGVVGQTMGSPGIRCYHMARVLAEQLPEARVTLSIPNESDLPAPHPRVRVVRHRRQWPSLLQMLRHDIIISRNFPPQALLIFPCRRLALDFYVAFSIEWLALSQRVLDPTHRRLWMTSRRHYVDAQLTLADYVLCSHERQRDLWVGALSALGLIPPSTYDADITLRRLIDVIPYGVQPGRPHHARQVLKGVVPGIREADKVLIWNGSIMEWFDAQTVIRAMAEVSRARDDVKLFFLGVEHPDWVTGLLFDPPKRAVELSKELGLFERSVFFNFGWTPYADIGNFLAEADIGVCAGFDNLEARYAFRTRLVDLFWAELPIVSTSGDVLADRIARDPLGLVVPPEDPHAFADAILRLVDDQELYQRCRANMPAIKEELSWERVLAPLVEFCRGGRSIAAPKRKRLLPLLLRSTASLVPVVQRAAYYALTHSRRMRGRS